MTPQPTAARDLLNLAIDNGWATAWKPNIASGGASYVSVEGVRGTDDVFAATWHTHDTGTYRLFTCTTGRNLGARDTTLTKLRALITTPKDAPTTWTCPACGVSNVDNGDRTQICVCTAVTSL